MKKILIKYLIFLKYFYVNHPVCVLNGLLLFRLVMNQKAFSQMMGVLK